MLWGTGGGGRLEPTLRSQGTSGSVLTPVLVRRGGKSASSAPSHQHWAQLPQDHRVLLVPNRLSSPGTTVPHGCCAPTAGTQPPSDCFPSATRYRNKVYSCTSISAYSGTGSRRDSCRKPRNLEVGRRGTESTSQEEPGGWSCHSQDATLPWWGSWGTSRALGTSPNLQASYLVAEVSHRSGETCTAHRHAAGARPQARDTAVPGGLEGWGIQPRQDRLLSWPQAGGMETQRRWLPFVRRTKNNSQWLPSLPRTRPGEAARKRNAARQSSMGRQRRAACRATKLPSDAWSPATGPEMGSTSKWHLTGTPCKLQAWGRWGPPCHHGWICGPAGITVL